ncbi:MAG: hypothetical protein WBE26_00910 [Phycisphaerae bacterium]
MPEENYIGDAAGVVAEHFECHPSPIQAGIAFLDMVGDHAGCDDCPVEVRDTEGRREYEGHEPTREQCMLGATLANALKAMCPAPRYDNLNPLVQTHPLEPYLNTLDETSARRVAGPSDGGQVKE